MIQVPSISENYQYKNDVCKGVKQLTSLWQFSFSWNVITYTIFTILHLGHPLTLLAFYMTFNAASRALYFYLINCSKKDYVLLVMLALLNNVDVNFSFKKIIGGTHGSFTVY